MHVAKLVLILLSSPCVFHALFRRRKRTTGKRRGRKRTGKRRGRKTGRDTNGSGKKGEVGRGRSRGV